MTEAVSLKSILLSIFDLSDVSKFYKIRGRPLYPVRQAGTHLVVLNKRHNDFIASGLQGSFFFSVELT